VIFFHIHFYFVSQIFFGKTKKGLDGRKVKENLINNLATLFSLKGEEMEINIISKQCGGGKVLKALFSFLKKKKMEDNFFFFSRFGLLKHFNQKDFIYTSVPFFFWHCNRLEI